jgi:hypothetical protein
LAFEDLSGSGAGDIVEEYDVAWHLVPGKIVFHERLQTVVARCVAMSSSIWAASKRRRRTSYEPNAIERITIRPARIGADGSVEAPMPNLNDSAHRGGWTRLA